MQLHLPVLGEKETGSQKTLEDSPPEPEAPPAHKEKRKESSSELPGGLADIIRDLTRRPPS